MSISTPRLYRKSGSGVYFVRVLAESKNSENRAFKTELRRSLQTNCHILAGKIVATLNAALAQIPMSRRTALYDDVHRQVLARFIGPEAKPMRIEGRDDMRNFLGFFEDLNQQGLEDFKSVFTERVATRGIHTTSPAFTVQGQEDRETAIALMKELGRPEFADLKEAMLTRLRGRPAPTAGARTVEAQPQVPLLNDAGKPPVPDRSSKTSTATAGAALASSSFAGFEEDDKSQDIGVENPLQWKVATARYGATLRAEKSVIAKTNEERLALLDQLEDYLIRYCGLKPGFYVHQVKKHHIAAFADHSATRLARGITNQDKLTAEAENRPLPTVKPRTLLKRHSNLSLFFKWAKEEVQATNADPTEGLHRRNAVLKKQKAETNESYEPFTAAQLQTMFKPVWYLEQCRDADHFWAPLLGLHLGARLGEFINLSLDQIQQHAVSGIWYMDLKPEDVKNQNSVRRLPITQPLIDLGFLEYADKLRELGAKTLFPHRRMDTVSALRQPSKNVSEKFARFMDQSGLPNKELVFHSFRHTVVTALQTAGVPLHVSQQIVGHAAQDHAIRTGHMTVEQARSVTLTVYTHADIPSLNAPDPFKVLKNALEDNLVLPLDYVQLKKAAAVVLLHTRKSKASKTGFDSGWAPQDKAYSEKILRDFAR